MCEILQNNVNWDFSVTQHSLPSSTTASPRQEHSYVYSETQNLHALRGCAKKQGAVSHSSSEAEIIAMDAALRMDGLLALELWDTVQTVLSSMPSNHNNAEPRKHQNQNRLRTLLPNDPWDNNDTSHTLSNTDNVPSSLPNPDRMANLTIFEDGVAVLKLL